MTNNNWEEEVKKIAWYLGCSEKELWSEISKILTKKDQEHKAELERILAMVKRHYPSDEGVAESDVLKGGKAYLDLIVMNLENILDSHINK